MEDKTVLTVFLNTILQNELKGCPKENTNTRPPATTGKKNVSGTAQTLQIKVNKLFLYTAEEWKYVDSSKYHGMTGLQTRGVVSVVYAFILRIEA